MNSGKTTAVASLAHGLSAAGHRVAAIKATGTGAFGDFNAFVDTGARYVADFTDAGMVSTYLQPLDRIEAGLDTLLALVCSLVDDGAFDLATGVRALTRGPGRVLGGRCGTLRGVRER